MDQSDIDLLSTVPAAHLQALLKARNLQPSAKGQRAKQGVSSTSLRAVDLAPRLFDPTLLKALLRDLGEIERLILAELVACGGRANSRDVALYLFQSGVIGPLKEPETARASNTGSLYPAPHPHGVFEQALRQLLLQGLIFWGKQTNFAGRDYASGIFDGIMIAPRAVINAVESLKKVTTPLEETLRTPVVHEAELGEGVRLFQRKLYLYCSLPGLAREGFPLLGNGLLSRGALRLVIEQLASETAIEHVRSEFDVPQLLFIRLLLQHLGLLYVKQALLYAAPADAFFALPLAERAWRCYQVWRDAAFWNELLYLPDVIVRPMPEPATRADEEVIRSRRAVIERIVQEPEETWMALSALIARTKLYVPYLLFPRRFGPRAERYSVGCNPYGLDFRLKRGWLTHREGWHLVEGGFIRAIIAGPLAWMGLVEMEGSAGTFRLIRRSTVLMSENPLVIADPAEGRLIVQPNFELVAMAPVSESLLIKLDRFAERVSLEQVAQYRLTRASVAHAIQIGGSAQEIIQILEQAKKDEIPQNVSYTLLEWERQARRIELWHERVVLEVDESARLDALLADEEFSQLFGRRLSPTMVEVAGRNLEVLQERFWARDLLPAVTPAPGEELLQNGNAAVAHDPQWRLHEDGLLEPIRAVSDLYLLAEVQKISEVDKERGWHRITPASIQRASEAGIELEQMIRFLQNSCLSGIPTAFLIRLKLWGGGYGTQQALRVEPAPLLRLSEKVLLDLRQDPELEELLGADVPEGERLVRVAAVDLERLTELLKRRGFDVERVE